MARWLTKLVVVVGLCVALLPAAGRLSWMQALWLGLAVTVATFLIGDLGALRRWGNAQAVVVDFLTATATLYLLARTLPGVRLPFGGALTVGGAVAVGEILYHQYLLQRGMGS